MSISVREFELLNDNLFSITWSNNQQSYLLLRDIRNACPCATCKAALKGFKKKIEVKNPECFELSHFICIFRANELEKLNKNLYNKDTIFYKIKRPVDVDTKEDLQRYYDKNNR